MELDLNKIKDSVFAIVGYGNYHRILLGDKLFKPKFSSVDEAQEFLCKKYDYYAHIVIKSDPFQMEQMGY